MEPNPSQQPPERPAPAGQAGLPASIVNNEPLLAVFSHLGGLFLCFLAPLVVYLVCKDSSQPKPFATEHAREALNFQITIAIVLAVLFFIPFVGWLLILPVLLTDFVLSLVATVKALNGERWRHPVTLRLVK